MVSKGILDGGVVSIDAKENAEGVEDITFALTKKGKSARSKLAQGAEEKTHA
jgi:hypothetical protein